MKWVAKYTDPKKRSFAIKHDPAVGYYLYAYNDTGREFFDDLQDTLDWAKRSAFDEFKIPLDAWKQVE